jgi:hypothetical protein
LSGIGPGLLDRNVEPYHEPQTLFDRLATSTQLINELPRSSRSINHVSQPASQRTDDCQSVLDTHHCVPVACEFR